MTRKEMIRAFRAAHMVTKPNGQKEMQATRAEFLAYGFARGRPYRHIELITKENGKLRASDLFFEFAQAIKMLIPAEELKDIDGSRGYAEWLQQKPADYMDRIGKVTEQQNAMRARKMENAQKYEKFKIQKQIL